MVRLAAALVVFLGAVTATADDTTAAQLLGKWRMVKTSEKAAIPPGLTATVEFAKGGKLTMAVEFMGKKEETPGTWKLDAKKLTVEYKEGDKPTAETSEVLKLTADVLVTKDEKGETNEFHRVKAATKKP